MVLIHFVEKFIKVNHNDLSFLNVGDIVWAKRYKDFSERKKYRRGHQESPYVVIKKTKKQVFAVQCTSNPHQEIGWKILYYPLGRMHYNISKNTYINCRSIEELTNVQFVQKLDCLTDYDLNQLKKHLFILKYSNYPIRINIEDRFLKFTYGIGDVILYNHSKYYICGIEGKDFLTYRLRKKIKMSCKILINNAYYSFIFERVERIKIRSKFLLVDTFHSGEVLKIEEFRNEYLKRTKNTKRLQVGSIIDYHGQMFYIYECSGDVLSAYVVYSNADFKKGMASIHVKGGIYHTFFKISRLSKRKLNLGGYKIRRHALKEEILYNQEIFKIPKNVRKAKRKEFYQLKGFNVMHGKEDFAPMVIIQNKNNNQYYLILDKIEDTIEIVNINRMEDRYYFELDRDANPFQYYRIMSKEEFDLYYDRVQEFKDIVAKF